MSESLQIIHSAQSGAAQSLFVRIADFTWEISSGDGALQPELDGATKAFQTTAGIPDVRIRAFWDSPPEAHHSQKLFDSGGLWRLFRADGDLRYEFTSPIFGDSPYMVATFTPQFDLGDVFLQRAFFGARNSIYPLHYPLDELLMMNLLVAGGGIEVHGCGIVDRAGVGRLFVGPSGAGKTTMVRLWEGEPGVRILSDDRIILRRVDGRIWMYGTPWHGDAEFADPRPSALDQIYFLYHGQQNKLIRKSGAEPTTLLFRCTFPPFHSSEGLSFTLGFCEEVIKAIPSFELHSVADPRLIEFLQRNLHRAESIEV